MFNFKEYYANFGGCFHVNGASVLQMKRIAIYTGNSEFRSDARVKALVSEFQEHGCECSFVEHGSDDVRDHDMLLSVGGDGTFLKAAMLAAGTQIPVAGVNLGRMGFLSENRPEDFASAVSEGDYTLESRSILRADVRTGDSLIDDFPYALNEMTVRRSGSAMLGVDVCVDGVMLPTYWGDGLVISTSSGSTAYSLSVGGPIVLPESKVFLISPIAPHNLNVRPMVVPDTSVITLTIHSRDGYFEFSADNRTVVDVPEDTEITVRVAQFSLNRLRLNKSNFIQALTEKLFWGEDVRNLK